MTDISGCALKYWEKTDKTALSLEMFILIYPMCIFDECREEESYVKSEVNGTFGMSNWHFMNIRHTWK